MSRAPTQARTEARAIRGAEARRSGRRAELLAAALETVSLDQRERLRRAAISLAARRPDLKAATVRLDLLALAPGRAPRHVPDAWKGG